MILKAFTAQKKKKNPSTPTTNPRPNVICNALPVQNVPLYYTSQTNCHSIMSISRNMPCLKSLLPKSGSCHLLSVQLPGDQ